MEKVGMDSLDCCEERENKYIMWNKSQPIEQDALQNNPGYPCWETERESNFFCLHFIAQFTQFV